MIYTVTPHVGVWIETINKKGDYYVEKVTPHVGVWIETNYSTSYFSEDSSHLM